MLNCDQARKDLAEIEAYLPHVTTSARVRLDSFIDDVEALLKQNSIKQTPALFKPKQIP